MKKFAYLFALVLTFALAGHAHAQDKMSGGKMSGAKMSGGKMAAATPQSFTGPVKGTPSGGTFILAMSKGPMTVDTSKAKARMNGKFIKMDTVKGGSMVTVTGKMSGTKFMADTVTVKSMPGGKKVIPKAAPMNSKMSGGKPKM